MAQGELFRRGEERHPPLPCGLDDLPHGLGPLRILQLGAITGGELLEALRVVSVPLAQLRGGGDLLAPLVQLGGVFAQPARPEAVDQDPSPAVGAGRVVDASDLDRRGDPLTISRFDRRARLPGELRAFDLELELRGDPFQKLVWERLLEIPFGETTSYGAIAQSIEESAYPAGLEPYRRPRLVGATIGRNPLPVVVPCHRVIGADGSLTGFSGGLERKRTLLELEGVLQATLC